MLLNSPLERGWGCVLYAYPKSLILAVTTPLLRGVEGVSLYTYPKSQNTCTNYSPVEIEDSTTPKQINKWSYRGWGCVLTNHKPKTTNPK